MQEKHRDLPSLLQSPAHHTAYIEKYTVYTLGMPGKQKTDRKYSPTKSLPVETVLGKWIAFFPQ